MCTYSSAGGREVRSSTNYFNSNIVQIRSPSWIGNASFRGEAKGEGVIAASLTSVLIRSISRRCANGLAMSQP